METIEKAKIIVNDEKWDLAFIKDKPSMLFGSMVNAYGQVNRGTGKSIDVFLKDMEAIWIKAVDLTISINNQVNIIRKELRKKDEGVDLNF